ncbi:MAG: uracil-DNA glycosylase [Caldimonas sp.]
MKAADLAAAFATLPPAWGEALPGWTDELRRGVQHAVEAASGQREIAPADPLRALRLVAPEAVRVVVVGQDPYPTAGHADGLAFSAGRGRPRSLARVFEILAADRPGFVPPETWALDAWARQGVLLLNPVLTVEVGRSNSHAKCGWQALTLQVIDYLARRVPPPIFLAWGGQAREFLATGIAAGERDVTVLATRHPSYDFKRAFMADGSHFEATAHLVDWWGIGSAGARVL